MISIQVYELHKSNSLHEIGTTKFLDKFYISRFENKRSNQMAIVVPKDEYMAVVNDEIVLIKDMSDEELAIRRTQIETEFWKVRAKEQAIHAELQKRDKERKKQQLSDDKAYVSPKVTEDNQKELADKLAGKIVNLPGIDQSAIDKVKAILAAASGVNIPTLHAQATLNQNKESK